MLSKNDRIAFSLKIVSADNEIKGINSAKILLQKQLVDIQNLDTANKNLLDPINSLVNGYQLEFTNLNGNIYTTFIESNILDSVNKKIGNYFYPNDETLSPPIPGVLNSIWTKIQPFALGYAIGANASGLYPSTTKESDLINIILADIAATGAYTDYQNTTGTGGTCSNPSYTDQPTCESNGGTWTGPQTLIITMIAHVNTLKSFLQTEVSLIVTDDVDPTRQAQNNAAINNINNVILPALTTWLAYPNFNGSNIPPTKLHSTQLIALQTALNNRLSFISTRNSQVSTVIGTISQDLNTGDVTGSGLYFKRYNFLSLRLNAFGGSLVKLISMQNAITAQTSIVANLNSTKSTYMSIVPTSLFKAPGNDTNKVNLADSSLFSVGDTIYVMAEGQEELQRAIKSISGTLVTLNDTVPAKYRPSEYARLYKDISQDTMYFA
jgi:hypothetical protein